MSANDEHYLRRELYALLRSNDEVFDFFQRGVLDGVWYWDLESPGNEWMSEGFWELLGYDPAERQHLFSEWQEIIDPEDLRVTLENIERHKADPRHPFDQEVRYRHADGSTVWVRCRGMAIRDENGVPIRMLGVHHDVTALKRAEARERELRNRIEERNQALEESNRRLSEFAYVVSHDLKAPLRGILTCVDWLEDEVGDGLSEDGRENFGFLRSRATRLTHLIDGVLSYSRATRHEDSAENLQLVEAIETVLADLAPPPTKTVKLEGDFPDVRYDPTQLRQVLQNLISNALEWSGHRDRSHGAGDASPGEVTIRGVLLDDLLRIDVIDDGPGIPENRREQVFDLFVTLQRRDDHESTGVGLSVARVIVERNGGAVGVAPAEGSGSRFWFTIPRDRIVRGSLDRGSAAR